MITECVIVALLAFGEEGNGCIKNAQESKTTFNNIMAMVKEGRAEIEFDARHLTYTWRCLDKQNKCDATP